MGGNQRKQRRQSPRPHACSTGESSLILGLRAPRASYQSQAPQSYQLPPGQSSPRGHCVQDRNVISLNGTHPLAYPISANTLEGLESRPTRLLNLMTVQGNPKLSPTSRGCGWPHVLDLIFPDPCLPRASLAAQW